MQQLVTLMKRFLIGKMTYKTIILHYMYEESFRLSVIEWRDPFSIGSFVYMRWSEEK